MKHGKVEISENQSLMEFAGAQFEGLTDANFVNILVKFAFSFAISCRKFKT